MPPAAAVTENPGELKKELEDFEAFLEPDFQPVQFANDLLLATNGSDGPELDLATPIKKLRFDIDECNKRMNSISGNNYEALVANFSRIEESEAILHNRINPSIERVNNSFERIKTEVVKPYEDALRLNNALRKIHLTLDLLRGASFFIFLIQQIEELEKTVASSTGNNSKDLVRLAKLHLQISDLYDENSTNAKDGSVLSIKLIRDYRPLSITKKSSLQTQCVQTITNEFNHHGSFTPKNTLLQSHLVALYVLNEKEFFSVFDKAGVNKQVQQSLTQLSRSLQSPRNFTAIITEIKEEAAEYFSKLTESLTDWDVTRNLKNKTSHQESTSLLNILLEHYEVQALSELYWGRLAHKFKMNIAATMARGGPIAKNLKIYYEGIRNSISETFDIENEKNALIDAVDLIQGAR
ncbi:Golgi transport complex subunit 5-domain-containing protein [Scheffersomyces xylosifermentans]|uniref:Golgi transport complex subunit 5-domain-containing protein n=1 Tax=Scheffersomyces xylosifermentans TaxID=1304137 RepID=UPI00315D7A3C